MSKTIQDLLMITLATFLITFAVWLPHLLKLQNFYNFDFSAGFSTIYRNFDGLEYVIIAKTFYKPHLISALPQSLPTTYYASHFPGYALLIVLFSPILGYLKSMVFISVVCSFLSALVFYFLLKDFKLSSQPVWLSIIFLIFPARWLVVHSIGSSEPLFIFFILSSIYVFLKFEFTHKNLLLWVSVFLGLAAQLTRPPGILFFIALMIYIHWKYFIKTKFQNLRMNISEHLKYYPIILIPAGLLLVFYWFFLSYGDFWAYFHSGDNIHLTFPPFQVFNKSQFWVGDIWLEDVVYIFTLGLLGGLMLYKQKLYLLAFFVLTYILASTLIAHRDISRYTLPVFPLLLIAFEKIIITKEFKIITALVILAIYLYAQNFILSNTVSIPNIEIFN